MAGKKKYSDILRPSDTRIGGNKSYSRNARKPEMVEEIRFLWCDVLDELLQCPVCLEVKEGQKGQCINGHHICVQCKIQLTDCPVCKQNFIATRNLTVEQISAKFKDIKLSLLDPNHKLNRRVLENKVCVSTQTEEPYKSSKSCECQTDITAQENGVSRQSGAARQNALQQKETTTLSPKVGKGTYPCRMGSCTVELPHGRMISHLRYYHKSEFFEFNDRCTVFKRNLDLEYYQNQYYDFAFLVKGMGLFFFNVSILRTGDLTANIQIVNCINVSKQFTYKLEIGKGYNKVQHSDVVKSCRVQLIHRDCLYIRNDNMNRLTNNAKSFHCHLLIRRKIDYSGTSIEKNSI